jgi:hypothetical protein
MRGLLPLPRFALAAMCAPSNIDSFAASSRTYRLAVSWSLEFGVQSNGER